jgi:hypothetical protein
MAATKKKTAKKSIKVKKVQKKKSTRDLFLGN